MEQHEELTMNTTPAFADNLAQLRATHNMTQEQLAKALDVDRTYICAIEKGRRFPSWRLLMDLSRVLEIDVYRLIFGLTK